MVLLVFVWHQPTASGHRGVPVTPGQVRQYFLKIFAVQGSRRVPLLNQFDCSRARVPHVSASWTFSQVVMCDGQKKLENCSGKLPTGRGPHPTGDLFVFGLLVASGAGPLFFSTCVGWSSLQGITSETLCTVLVCERLKRREALAKAWTLRRRMRMVFDDISSFSEAHSF